MPLAECRMRRSTLRVGALSPPVRLSGGILFEWMVANAAADVALALTGDLIAEVVGLTAVAIGWPAAVGIGLALLGLVAVGAAWTGESLGGYLWDKLISVLQKIGHDPLVLDLAGDGVQLSSLNGSNVHFDFAGDGSAERTAWVGSSDGILVLDANGNGTVDNGSELFGSATQDGFAVLETFDSNQDGIIDSSDAAFSQLRIWKDLNQNGVSDIGELQTLSDAGIVSISLSRHEVGGTNAGNGVGYEASFTLADGSTRAIQSITLQVDQRHPAPDEDGFTPATGVALLPQFAGSGLIHSIAYKATNDQNFRADWTQLADDSLTLSPTGLRERLDAMLQQWAGVENVDPAGRGPYVDGRHLAFLEFFFGETYLEAQRNEALRTYPSTAELARGLSPYTNQFSGCSRLASSRRPSQADWQEARSITLLHLRVLLVFWPAGLWIRRSRPCLAR